MLILGISSALIMSLKVDPFCWNLFIQNEGEMGNTLYAKLDCACVVICWKTINHLKHAFTGINGEEIQINTNLQVCSAVHCKFVFKCIMVHYVPV